MLGDVEAEVAYKSWCRKLRTNLRYYKRAIHQIEMQLLTVIQPKRKGALLRFRKRPARENRTIRDPKERTRFRDGHICQVCSTYPAITVHHINYNPNDDREDNLTTLCARCHAHTNGSRDAWEAFFRVLTAAKRPTEQTLRKAGATCHDT